MSTNESSDSVFPIWRGGKGGDSERWECVVVVSEFPVTSCFNASVTLFYWLHFPVTAFQLPFKCLLPLKLLQHLLLNVPENRNSPITCVHVCVCMCVCIAVAHLSKTHIPKSWPHIRSGCGALCGYDFNKAGILFWKQRNILRPWFSFSCWTRTYRAVFFRLGLPA